MNKVLKKSLFGMVGLISLVGFFHEQMAQSTDSQRDGQTACAQSHIGTTRDLPPGTTVQICDQFYDQAPLVRLPETDDFSHLKQVTFYGAIDNMGPAQSVIADRTGQKWLVLNANGELNPTYDYSAFPTNISMPSNMYLYLIYHFQGKVVSVPGAVSKQEPGLKGIILTSANPVIYIPGALMDNYLLGSWEGSINLRLDPAPSPDDFGSDLFDSKSQVPVRMRFSQLRPFSEPLASSLRLVWPDVSHDGQRLQDITFSDAVGTVENDKAEVTGSNGTCLQSLASFNRRNPFLGATSNAVEFYRYPSMHGAGSEAMVMVFPPDTQGLPPTGMSLPFFMKASTLILEQPRFIANEFPHGLHRGFEIGGFHKVQTGGSPCSTN